MRFFLVVFAFVALASPAFAQSSMSSPSAMHGMAAMPSCASGDPTVWINTRSKVYYMKGAAYYGKTSKGKYTCLSSAKSGGAHAPGMHHTMASPGPRHSMGITTPMPMISSSPSP